MSHTPTWQQGRGNFEELSWSLIAWHRLLTARFSALQAVAVVDTNHHSHLLNRGPQHTLLHERDGGLPAPHGARHHDGADWHDADLPLHVLLDKRMLPVSIYYVYIHVCLDRSMRVYLCICLSIDLHIYIYMFMFIFMYRYIYMCVCVCVCARVSLYLSLFLYIHNIHTYIYIYIYIYIHIYRYIYTYIYIQIYILT